jgi:uncharacterized membrane protein YccF (DUF307 family)
VQAAGQRPEPIAGSAIDPNPRRPLRTQQRLAQRSPQAGLAAFRPAHQQPITPNRGITETPRTGGQTRAAMLEPGLAGSMLRFLLNVLWFVLGGFVMGLGWWLAGLVAAVTIVGIPWARACFVIGNFSFWPFGYEAVSRRELTGRMDFGTGPLGLVGNLIWFLLAGWWLAIGHLSSALACFISIIGIPFGIQHIKLALIALAPIGMQVVPTRR